MSYINLYEDYNNKLRKFGVNTSARFKNSYVEAVNLAYAELNDLVFQNQTLEYIDSFDDIIDKRLSSFNTIIPDNTTVDAKTSGFGHWASEYEFERKSDTNGFTDTFAITAGDIVLDITNGVFGVTVAAPVAVTATYTLPDQDSVKIKFEVNGDGNTLYIDDAEMDMTYSAGTALLQPPMGTINTHTISGTTGYILKRFAFYSPTAILYDFLLDEGGVETSCVDQVAAYVAVVDTPVWQTVYIEPSSGLDSQYRSPFNMAIDYHLQDGGEWAIEPEAERERKWYQRGIKQARNIYQQNSTYTPPLGS